MPRGKPKVLVTGATGFLGRRLAARLVAQGYQVRALLRNSSRPHSLRALGVEIVPGDVRDEASIAAAVGGVGVVVHAAAGAGDAADIAGTSTVRGTRNVLEACSASRVGKLIYISSCAVYEVVGHAENRVITEDAQLERFPIRRGRYSAAKLEAELLVAEAMKRRDYAIVVLRPGTLYGPGGQAYTNLMGASLAGRLFLVFGDGSHALPLVHVDDVVDAIIECMENGAADNQTFNLVDRASISKRMYMDRVVKPLHLNAIVVYVPMPLILGLTRLQETLLGLCGKPPLLSLYRLMSSQMHVRFSASRIESVLGWRSRIVFAQGAEQLIREHAEMARKPAQTD